MHACWALQVRVPTNIVSSICDDRGEEPTYNGVDMSTLIEGECSCLPWAVLLHCHPGVLFTCVLLQRSL